MSDQRAKGPTDRLPSLKGKRDLTLGGVKKKVYVPNIPVRRPKPEAPPKTQESTPTIKPVPSSKSKKAPPLEKGRGKRRREIVTSASVFSMGPAEGARGRGGATFGSVKKDTVVKEERKSNNRPIKREVEGDYESSGEEGEASLHRSDIASVFSSCPLPPVQLPLKHFSSDKEKPLALNIQIKEEPMDTDMVLVKPVHPVSETSQTSPSEIFQPTEEGKGQFLLFQLPDCLPLPSLSPSPDESSSIVTGSLRDIPDGLIGRLSVYKSGRVNIGLGDVSLNVAMGTRGGFLQEIASLKSTTGEGSFIPLGHLSHKLNCTPDLESLGLHTER
ncbi:PREDICTED: DNA-directed RNA polymerase III subunit RPC4-like isoform X1 [Amphimedon queenslandica]|uniref:DNA-directed RNA polymerase III subunit RPC4 n=1 Tax=Amphimedon queenslandica TaxID=400682 RepID=A0A1X7VI58_AMPQE|nr:PREDICTED: DNA-directed RNA polymerase III subunit RPC4-like isoform X1 [Amphimedon queenslandica]|eukprot:XP_011410145.1 PREDICTED: DNA-directed RNA polymerase III subunit RPC4-like isoform X1 [Amphimedon queenslandica]